MLIIGYCYGIRFEQEVVRGGRVKTLRTAGSAASILTTRFLMDSTSSVNRHGRFRDSDLFRQLFEAVVRACMDAGLVKGEAFAVNASVMEADASRYHAKAPEEMDWSLPEASDACSCRVSARS